MPGKMPGDWCLQVVDAFQARLRGGSMPKAERILQLFCKIDATVTAVDDEKENVILRKNIVCKMGKGAPISGTLASRLIPKRHINLYEFFSA